MFAECELLMCHSFSCGQKESKGRSLAPSHSWMLKQQQLVSRSLSYESVLVFASDADSLCPLNEDMHYQFGGRTMLMISHAPRLLIPDRNSSPADEACEETGGKTGEADEPTASQRETRGRDP